AGTFKGNEASDGGAISSIGSNSELTVNGGSFENNESTGTWGGAIVAKNKVSVKNATFDANVSGNGGAIFAFYANNSVFEHCTFKNNSGTNNTTAKHGGALFVNGSKDVSIKNNTFTKNTAKDGGALYIYDVEGVVEGNTFEENFADIYSSAFHLKDSSVTITSNTFKNNGKNEDKVTSDGTFMVESVKNNGVIEADGNTFENNTAGSGGAAVVQAGTVDFNGCSFNKNNAAEYGGAIYITQNGNVNITNSKFEDNSAKRGGAIVTELFSQANPAEKEKYANLTIADDVEFDKNFASDGYFNPPTNYKDFPKLEFKTTSLMGQLRAIKDDMKTYDKVDSLLNNYDVYYANPLVI
ncbi:MAG: right-handed parallel beta-helix repeat-containing protein, partial [Serratia marcescens]|nr:right-handed parallel beta-helix repeat-containing protein [Serratia marcescens]